MWRLVKNILGHQQFQKLSVYGFGQAFNLVTPLLVIPYIVAVCGEENFGKTAVGMALSFFLMVFIDYGSDITKLKEVSVHRDNQKQLNHVFTNTYAVKFFVLIIVLLIISLLFISVPYFKKESILFFLGLTVLVGQFLNPTWFLQGVENVKWITVLNIISKSIYLIGVFLMVKNVDDYIYINMWWGIGMIVAHFIVLIAIIKSYRFSLNNFSLSKIKNHLYEDFKIFSSQIFFSIQLNAPVLLVSYFGGNLLAGQYRIVEQIILVFKTYILLFFNFVYPRICYLVEHEKAKVIKNWLIYNGANFIFVALGMAILFVFSSEAVAYFNTDHPEELSSLLRVAVFLPLVLAISIPLKQLILANDYKKLYVNLTILIVLLMLFVTIWLMPKFKIYAVLYALILAELITIFFYLYRLKDNFKQDD